MSKTLFNDIPLGDGINDEVSSLQTTWSGTKIKNKFAEVEAKITDVPKITSHTVLLPASQWVDGFQTVTIPDATPNSIVVLAAVGNPLEYNRCSIYVFEQAQGQITFTFGTIPQLDITVNAVVINNPTA